MNEIVYAPFPYFGGKRRYAEKTWEMFGNPKRYLEPFAGSMAILLGNPNPCLTEIANDLNGFVANFWRSVIFDPEQTCHWCQYPSSHIDLTSRQAYLYDWRKSSVERLMNDCHYHDPKIAGWWCWGVSNWIGTPGYAEGKDSIHREERESQEPDKDDFFDTVPRGGRTSLDPFRDSTPSNQPRGQGVQMRRKMFSDSVPLTRGNTGHGSQMRRKMFGDVTPYVHYISGRGAQLTRPGLFSEQTNRPAWHADKMYDMIEALSVRLARVTFLCRDWKSFTSPTMLGNVKTEKTETAIFLDPPYKTADRTANVYQSDLQRQSDNVSDECYEWAVANGETIKVAFCCQEGDYPVPEGWTTQSRSLSKQTHKEAKYDIVMYSPLCSERRASLFGD